MIVVEGMDNTGKTTLCERLHEDLSKTIPYLRYLKSPGPLETWQEAVDWTKRAMEKDKQDPIVLYDRHPMISEYIYGPKLRGGRSHFDHPVGRELQKMFFELQPLIVYCRPKLIHILNFGAREQMKGVRTKALTLTEAYDDFIKDHIEPTLGVVRYDYNLHPYEDIRDKARQHLNNRMEV